MLLLCCPIGLVICCGAVARAPPPQGRGVVAWYVPLFRLPGSSFQKRIATAQAVAAASACNAIIVSNEEESSSPAADHACGLLLLLLPCSVAGQPPVVKFTPEEGPAASVTIFNIYVGRVSASSSGQQQPKPAAGSSRSSKQRHAAGHARCSACFLNVPVMHAAAVGRRYVHGVCTVVLCEGWHKKTSSTFGALLLVQRAGGPTASSADNRAPAAA